MPLKKSKSKSNRSINKAVQKNIKELYNKGTKSRSHKQIVAIAENAARGGNNKKKQK